MSSKVKMTISIPAELREAMKRFDRHVNWSEIAAASFEAQRLREIEKLKCPHCGQIIERDHGRRND